MVLLIGSKDESTVHHVLNWLSYYKVEFINISYREIEYFIESIELSDDESTLSFDYFGVKISLNEIKSVWYRKAAYIKVPDLDKIKNVEIFDSIQKHLSREARTLKYGIFTLLENAFTLGDPIKNDINKIYSLICAKKVGLSIPSTLISTKLDEIKNFKGRFGRIITKNIQDSFRLNHDQDAYMIYTEEIEDTHLKDSSSSFFPSLVQRRLDKQYEIRVFYLNMKCFAMAIFSQEDDQTSTDFRKYNWQNMNRMVPYNISWELEQKLVEFMKLVDLETGSIDLIYSLDNKYVFLEVNPVGQYGFVSYNCNYYLEREIAKHLINDDRR